MGGYTELLAQAANEAREFERSAPPSSHHSTAWLELLAKRMEQAASIDSLERQELEMLAIARSLCDSGPTENSFAPSFHKALDALQKDRKKRRA